MEWKSCAFSMGTVTGAMVAASWVDLEKRGRAIQQHKFLEPGSSEDTECASGTCGLTMTTGINSDVQRTKTSKSARNCQCIPGKM